MVTGRGRPLRWLGLRYVDVSLASHFSKRDGRGPWQLKRTIPLRAVCLLGHGVPIPHVSIPHKLTTGKERNLRRTQLLDAQPREPLAHIDRLLKRLPLDETSKEPTSKGVTRTVGVVDLLLGNGVDGDLLDLGLALGDEERGLGALGDDDDALALRVLLGEVGDVAGDVLGGVGGKRVRLGVGGRLGLVANDVIAVGDSGVQDVLKELGDEGGREVQDEGLVLGRRELAELLNGGRTD